VESVLFNSEPIEVIFLTLKFSQLLVLK
jgi:hypothetical protein